MDLWGSCQSRTTSRWHLGCRPSFPCWAGCSKDRQVDCETSQWRLLVRVGSREVRDMAMKDTRLSMEKRESRATSVRN